VPKVSDLHREARRSQILRASIDCFASEGFHRTTMGDIIKKSGLSAGAIYQYFSSKEAIIEAIASERHREETTIVQRFLDSGDLREGLSALARDLFGLLERPGEKKRRKVAIQVWVEAMRSKDILRIVRRGLDQSGPIAAKLEAAQAGGQLPAGVSPAALTRAMLALFQGFLLQQAWEPDVSVDEYLQGVLFLIESAFGPKNPAATNRQRCESTAPSSNQ
jgi:AcrR family transcriptional regulator